MASYNAANSIHNAEYDSGESQLPQTVKVLEEGQILQFADLRKILDNSKIGPGKKLKQLKRIVNEIVTAGEYENFLEEKRANPKWSRYEIILLVEAYKEHGANCETIAHELRTKKPMQVRQFISRHREFLETISAMPDNGERHTYLKQYMQIPTRNPSPLTTTIKLADQIETPISDPSGAVSLDSNADYSDNLVDMAELPEHPSSDEYVEPDSEDNEIMEMDEQPEPMQIEFTLGNEKNSFDESSVDKVIYEAKIDKGINSAIDRKSNLIDQTETSSSSSSMSVSCPSPSSSSPILTPPSMGKISQSNIQQQSQTISHHDNVLPLTRSQCESILDQPMSHSINESSFGSNLNVFGNQVTLHKPMPLQMTQCNTHMTIDSHKATCESANLKTSFNEPTHSKAPIPTFAHSNVPISLQNPTHNYAKFPVHSQTYPFVPTSTYSNVPVHAQRFTQVPLNMNAQSFSHGALPNHAQTSNPMFRAEYPDTPTTGHTPLPTNATERTSTSTQLPSNSRNHMSLFEASFTHNQLPTQAHSSNQAPVAWYSESPYSSHQLTYKPLPAYLNTPMYTQTHSNVPVREPTSSQVPYMHRPLYETGSTRTQQATHLQNAAPETGHTYPYTPSYAQTHEDVHTFTPNHTMFNAQIHPPLYDNYRMSAQASQFHTPTYQSLRTHSHVPTPTNPNISTHSQVPFNSYMHNTESYEAYSNRTQMHWQTLYSNIATYGSGHHSHAQTHGNAPVISHHPTYVSRTLSNWPVHGPSSSSQMPFETHVHNSLHENLSPRNQTVKQTPNALYAAPNTCRNYHTNANTSPFSNVSIQPFYKTSSTRTQLQTHSQNSTYAAFASTRENVFVPTAPPNQTPFDRQMHRPSYGNYLFQKSAQASHHHSQNFEHFRTHSNVPKNANPNFASPSQMPFNAHVHSALSYEPTYSNRTQTASQPLHSNIATYKSANQSLMPTQVPTHANPNITAPPLLPFNELMHSTSSNVPVTATHRPTYKSNFSNIPMHAPSSTQVPFETNVHNPLHETLSTRKQTLSQTQNGLYAALNTSTNYHTNANTSTVPVPASNTSTQETFDEESYQPVYETLTIRTQNSTQVPPQNQLSRNTTLPVNSQKPTTLSEPAYEAVTREYASVIRNTQAPTGSILKQVLTNNFDAKTKLAAAPVSASPQANLFPSIAHETPSEHMHSSEQELVPQPVGGPKPILSDHNATSIQSQPSNTQISDKCAKRAPLSCKSSIKVGVLDKLLRKSQFEKKLIEKQKPTAEIVESDNENRQRGPYKKPLMHWITPASDLSEMKVSHMVADYETQQCNSRLNQVLKELRMRNKNVSIRKQNFRSNKVKAPMSMNTAKANKKFTIQGLQTKARFLIDTIQNDDLLTKQRVSDTLDINLFKKTDSTLSFRPTPGKREPMFELIKPHHRMQL